MTGSPITKAPETFYRVEVSDRDGQIVTIEPEMLAGRAIGEPEEKALRAASDSLTGFIGRRSYDSLARELENAKAHTKLDMEMLRAARADNERLREALRDALREIHNPGYLRNMGKQDEPSNWERLIALKPSNEVGT